MTDPIDMVAVMEAAKRRQMGYRDPQDELLMLNFAARILDMPPEVREAVERWDAQSGNVSDDYKVAGWFVGVMKGAKSEQ